MTSKHDAQLCSSASEAPATGGQTVSRKRGRTASKNRASGPSEGASNRVLCPTCLHVDHCVLFSSGERPAWHCEEFESAGAPPRSVEAAPVSPTTGKMDERKHLGLCVNCEDRDTCTFPRPEGGVWRCNEYR